MQRYNLTLVSSSIVHVYALDDTNICQVPVDKVTAEGKYISSTVEGEISDTMTQAHLTLNAMEV